MPELQARTIIDLVESVSQVRALTDKHPELRHVAQELLTMNGPLPLVGSHGNGSNGRTEAVLAGRPTPTPEPKRKKLHWTQRPENAHILERMAKKSQRTRRRNAER